MTLATRVFEGLLALRAARGAAPRARLSRRLINDARFEPEGSHLCPRPSAIQKRNLKVPLLYGGERGIRTLDRGLTYTPLAGERLQPLGHLSGARIVT